VKDEQEFEYDVFISYSSHDQGWVRGELLKRIEEAGLRVFIDFRDFKRGAPSIKEMERGVTACRKTLIILTPAYATSEWCEIENIMLQTLSPANQDLRLIPLLKVPCSKPLRIAALTHIDFTDPANLDLAWSQLLDTLKPSSVSFAEQPIPAEIQSELERANGFTSVDKYSDAIPILEQVLVAADNSMHAEARIKIRLSLARSLYEAREDSSNAERHFRDALDLVPTGKLDLRHKVLLGLGEMLLTAGRLEEAKAVFHAAYNIAKQTGDTVALAFSLISLSLLDRALGLYDSAANNLDEAVHLLLGKSLSVQDDKKTRIAGGLGTCYFNKALSHRDNGNLEEALALFSKANEQYRISGDKLKSGKALLFCGEVHCTDADWESGFDCFRNALQSFKETTNHLWCARTLEHIARLYAAHEQWDDAVPIMLAAARGAQESGHYREQVHLLCLAAKLVRKWKVNTVRKDALRMVHAISKELTDKQQGEVMPRLSEQMPEFHDSIDAAVRQDQEVRDLLKQAREIATKENLYGDLADCLLDEVHDIMPPDDVEGRRKLVAEAIDLLRKELRSAQFPHRRGHLMGRISSLYWELGQAPEAQAWLRKAGDVFQKSGDAFGLANFYGSLAEMHRSEGRLDEQIAAYRQALAIIEGRSFYFLAAQVRVRLAEALRYRRKFDEAQRLLNEAEALCDRHQFNNFISQIAHLRNNISTELQASQAPKQTFPQLLRSLDELIKFRPQDATAYLPFWFFTWKTELAALVRSGPHLSLMIVTDNVPRFMKFAVKFRYLADFFLMTNCSAPTVKVEARTLSIPPTWLFPPTFPFIFAKRRRREAGESHQSTNDIDPPSYHLAGPATTLPPYMPIEVKSDVKGEEKMRGMMALSSPFLPQAAIELMIKHSTKELTRRRAVWFPTPRSTTKDGFLTDLQVSYERGIFPVYFDQFPTSEAVTVCGGVQISIPNIFLSKDHASIAAKWKRTILKLTTLSKNDAQAAILDLPEVFADIHDNATSGFTQMEIRLFEFTEIDQKQIRPVFVVRD